MSPLDKMVVSALLAGTVLALILCVVVTLMGGTFNARCNRIYPDKPLLFERCMYRLSQGLDPSA